MPDVPLQFANANDVVTSLLKTWARNLEKLFDGDVLFYRGLLFPPAERMIRDALEARNTKRSKLVFFLETEGGNLEVVVRIVETVRHHYTDCVEFVVPNYAFSAGTVLVLSGDEIWMDYFSVLGPTDPQDELPDGRLVPALGYVERYNELIAKSGTPEGLTTAEMTILVSSFDEGRLKMFKHYSQMAIALLTEWLPRYKFKNWLKTQTRGLTVTPQMRADRAKTIAEKLSDTEKWHSHGRGISKAVLENDPELRLQVNDFGENPDKNKAIRDYSGLLLDFAGKVQMPWFVHTPNGFVLPYGTA